MKSKFRDRQYITKGESDILTEAKVSKHQEQEWVIHPQWMGLEALFELN